DQKIVLHTIPSGVFHPHSINIIGNGVVLDPVVFKRECGKVSSFGVDLHKNLFISEKTHLILPSHRALDKASELAKGNDKIGSTLKGIGPAYMDKTGRNGIRLGDLVHGDFTSLYQKLKLKHQQLLDNFHFTEDISKWEEEFFDALDFLKGMNIVNGEYFINDLISQGKRILAEGAQGSMLDVDFGTYPFVTSSNTISAGVCTGLGIAPKWVKEVIGVTKAYCTRVGGGPFPTELMDETGEQLRKLGSEYGATTGRPRRCGWMDLVALNYSCMLSGVSELVMTKADVLDSFSTIKAATAYQVNGDFLKTLPFNINHLKINPKYVEFPGWESDSSGCNNYGDLPLEMRKYIKFIESGVHVPVRYVSNGPGRDQIISQ
ncbi:MAG: adenylosuccinate synthase, partial [Chitinophagaceae bacterium]